MSSAFVPSGTENDVHHPFNPPKITDFTQVSEDAVAKIIKNQLQNSVSWIHGQHISSKNAVTYHGHHIRKLFNGSLHGVTYLRWCQN